jgi:hypothetical protein
MVVDGAVENDADTEGRVEHRLMRQIGRIHHLEAAMAKRHVVLRIGAFAVRTARRLAFVYLLYAAEMGFAAVKSDFSGDAAHELCILF